MKHNLVIDAQGMVDYDIYQLQKLDEQLLDIFNLQIDDYDQSLAQLKKKKEILSGVASKAAEREAAHQLEVCILYIRLLHKDIN
jgi:hypothetical protein